MEPAGPASSRRIVERLVEAQRIGGMGDWEYDLVDV